MSDFPPTDEKGHVVWSEHLYAQFRDIARKAIVNPYSGLHENPDCWIYYFQNIDKCPDRWGDGKELATPRNFV